MFQNKYGKKIKVEDYLHDGSLLILDSFEVFFKGTDGKATEALKSINDMDDKLLVSMSNNPPPMLKKSSGNDNK